MTDQAIVGNPAFFSTPYEIPYQGKYDHSITVGPSPNTLIKGTVAVRIESPAYIKISYEILKQNSQESSPDSLQSLTESKQVLFEWNDPIVSAAHYREKVLPVQFLDSSANEQDTTYVLRLTNETTSDAEASVLLDYVTLAALKSASYHPIHQNLPGTPALILPPQATRKVNLSFTNESKDPQNVLISFVLSIANVQGQEFRPWVLFDLQRDRKSILPLHQPSVLLSGPTLISAQGGLNEFQAVFSIVDNAVPHGCYTYELLLINQTEKAKGLPTYLEVEDAELAILQLSSAHCHCDFVEPIPNPNPFAGNQFFVQGVDNDAKKEIWIYPGAYKEFWLRVPREAKHVWISGNTTFDSSKTICELQYNILRDSQPLGPFEGPHYLQVPFAAREKKMTNSLPLLFGDNPKSSGRCYSKDPLIYSIEIYNASKPFGTKGAAIAKISSSSLVAIYEV